MIRIASGRSGVKRAAVALFVPITVIGLPAVADAAANKPALMSAPTTINATTGDTLADKAVVTGVSMVPAPGGSVAFSLFTNATCTGPAVETSAPVTLVADTPNPTGKSKDLPVTNTFTTVPQAAISPTYTMQVTYTSTDLNYATTTGSCDVINIGPATPTITTTPSAH